MLNPRNLLIDLLWMFLLALSLHTTFGLEMSTAVMISPAIYFGLFLIGIFIGRMKHK